VLHTGPWGRKDLVSAKNKKKYLILVYLQNVHLNRKSARVNDACIRLVSDLPYELYMLENGCLLIAEVSQGGYSESPKMGVEHFRLKLRYVRIISNIEKNKNFIPCCHILFEVPSVTGGRESLPPSYPSPSPSPVPPHVVM
jgi:hypothetical protein